MSTISAAALGITCGAEVFIATALLHREHIERKDFTIQEIVNRAVRENLAGEVRSGGSVLFSWSGFLRWERSLHNGGAQSTAPAAQAE